MGHVEYVEVARSVSERGELVLRERRADRGAAVLELRANGVFVMDTAETGTEQALAATALAFARTPQDVLVGGLGLGFTLHAVLADPRVERCTVVEIEPALVDWMWDGTIPHGPDLLADPRVTVVVADIGAALAEAVPASYDAVLLDVDNGPGHLVHAANAALYDVPFLRVVRHVLRPGGVAVVWSAAAAPELLSAMRRTFDAALEHPQDVELQGRAEHYWLYVAQVASQG